MKNQTIFECSKCGAQNPKWAGRCSECGTWGGMKEITNYELQINNKNTNTAPPAELTDFNNIKGEDVQRISTGLGEVDRVLGGGIVPGSLILLGGEPGIGKSTLLLQLASQLSSRAKPRDLMPFKNATGEVSPRAEFTPSSSNGLGRNDTDSPSPVIPSGAQAKPRDPMPPKKQADEISRQARNDIISREVIYVSGEESAEQIKMRFDRLGLTTNNIKYLGETDIDIICATLKNKKPTLAIVDSIQTTTSQEVESSLGSTAQIRSATAKLMETAKGSRIPIIIIGHITKDGDIAGPKTLEHMVDAVLYFEGEKLSHYRILRAVKNRFGNTNEIGIFEMESAGLREVANPSAAFLEQKSQTSGSAITCVLNGNRPILVEIQALTNPTTFGYPLRKSSGFDLNRLNIIATIINQRTNIKCASHDIILNVAGGIKVNDTAADLAVALAIISSLKNTPLPNNLVAMGELGLGGEIRKIPQPEKRIEEARRLGLEKILSPSNQKLLQEVINHLIF